MSTRSGLTGFDVFTRPATERGGRSRGVLPTIRITKPGLLTFNRPAAELYAAADVWLCVRLLHNPDTGDIAVEATDDHDLLGYRSRLRASGGVYVSAKAFIDHLGVAPGTTYFARREGVYIIGERQNAS